MLLTPLSLIKLVSFVTQVLYKEMYELLLGNQDVYSVQNHGINVFSVLLNLPM